MRKTFSLLALAAAAATASGSLLAQEMEPGEWQFDTTVTSPTIPKPETSTFTRCVKKEDAGDPSRMMGRQEQQTDCKVNLGQKSPGSASWTMSCPQSGLQGQGSARYSAQAVQSEMRMTGELQGRRLDVTTKTTGKRLGPCKS